MRQASKIFNTFLSFTVALFSLAPYSGSVFAEQSEQLTLNSVGQQVAVVSAVNPPANPVAEVSESTASNSSTNEFLTDDNPLSATDKKEEVSIESNDPFYSTSGSWGQSYDDLWWLKRVRADQAWTYTRGAGATVAVIDTGLDYTHPDIAANLWTNPGEIAGNGIDDDGDGFIDDVHGWDYVNGDNDPRDDHGHGTHVSGIIAAAADNALGIAGVAPESKIIPIKVLGATGSGFVTDVIAAIRYAANLGAQVINLSLGILKSFLSKSLKSSFESAVSYAKNKGTIVVAAAGNSNANVANNYPGGIKDVIAVGATDPNNQRAWFSNFGLLLDFVAPGVDVLSLKAAGVSFGASSVVDPDYVRATGTSMASPVVAGVVALLRAQNPAITYNQILDKLKRSAIDLGPAGFDTNYGWGLVDAFGALTLGAQAASKSASSVSLSAASNPVTVKASQRSGAKFFDELTAPVREPLPVFSLGEQLLGYFNWRPATDSTSEDQKSEKNPHRRYKKNLLSSKPSWLIAH